MLLLTSKNRSSSRPGLLSGFTLIEMIVVMVLMGIMSAFGMGLITLPVRALVDQSRRAELVDLADNALRQMSRELRQALPNSVRITSSGSRVGLEYLHTISGGRFRANFESDGSGDPLENLSADSFDVLGQLLASGSINYSGTVGQAECLSGGSDCLVIYNTGTSGSDYNAYNGDNIATISNIVANQISYNNGAGWSFPFSIPPTSEQRFFVVNTPVSYVCDTASNVLWRYSNYDISSSQPISSAAFAAATANRMALKVVNCDFSYNSGAGSRHGLATLRMTLRDADSGEQVALLHQVHVVNVP